MAYEYKVAPIDLEGVAKAYSETASQIMKFRIQQDESIRKSIDSQYRMLSGKIRKVDLGEFEQKFAEWENSGKQAMRLNKGGNRQDLTIANISKEDAKMGINEFIKKSNSVAGMADALGKYYKDPTKVYDSDKLIQTYTDLTSLSVGDLEKKYGSLDKIPMDFEYTLDDFDNRDVQSLFGAVKGAMPKVPNTYLKEPVPAIDPATGKQKTKPMSFEFGGRKIVLNVPLKVVKGEIDPMDVTNTVVVVTRNDSKAKAFLKLNKDQYLKDYADPNSKGYAGAKDFLDEAVRVFGVKNPAELTDEQVFAAQLARESNTQAVELPDWKTLNLSASLIAKENGLRLDDLQEKALKKRMSDEAKALTIGQLSTFINVVEKAQNSGFILNDNFANVVNSTFSNLGFKLDKDVILQATKDRSKLTGEKIDVISSDPTGEVKKAAENVKNKNKK